MNRYAATACVALALLFGACREAGAPATTTQPRATASAAASPTAAMSPTPVKARPAKNSDCPLSEPQRPRLSGTGFELDPFCLFWNDGIETSGGFRLILTYVNSREVFIYDVPPGSSALIPDAAAAPGLEISSARCGDRHVFTVSLSSLPDLRGLDATGATVECGSPVR